MDRPYQGYPYTKPYVIDAPSIDDATASLWNNLPRRPIQPPTSMVYVDLPEEGSQVSRRNDPKSSKNGELEDPAGAHVIYIDVPDSSSSDVAGPASPEPEPEYVQETIFYDPFENRRIDRQKRPAEEAETPDSDSGSSSSRPPRPVRPPPPNHLNLNQASSSGYSSTYTSPISPGSLYGRTDNDFPISPIPVSEFPNPPPAYSEINTHASQKPHASQGSHASPEQQTVAEPPRTIVITQGHQNTATEDASPIGLPNSNRKVVICQHCGLRVHTLVFWESGPITHYIALFIFCLFFPLLFLVYCTNCCKYQNHYCPNCNQKIGYEKPALCTCHTQTNMERA